MGCISLGVWDVSNYKKINMEKSINTAVYSLHIYSILGFRSHGNANGWFKKQSY